MNQPKEINLKRAEDDDLPQLFAWRNDPSIYRWCRQHSPIYRSDHQAWAESLANDFSKSMFCIWDEQFVVKESNYKQTVLVGFCGLTSIDYINSRAEFSLYIGPEYQGRGYGEAALCALIKHGFNALNLNSIWGESFEGNPAIKMFERVGFIQEGVRRDFYYRDGRYINAILFSVTKPEQTLG